jgi:hypothetical protein
VKQISYKRHRFPPTIIRHAVWLYLRFTPSLQDIEDLLAERGIEVSFEAPLTWTQKFAVRFARNLRRSRVRPIGQSSGSAESGCSCGGLSMTRGGPGYARLKVAEQRGCSGTPGQSAEASRRAPRGDRDGQTCVLRCRRHGARLFGIATSRPACRPTIGRKIRTCRCADGSASAKGLRARDQPSGSFRSMEQSTM